LNPLYVADSEASGGMHHVQRGMVSYIQKTHNLQKQLAIQFSETDPIRDPLGAGSRVAPEFVEGVCL